MNRLFDRLFEIQTLSDHTRLSDPVAIITGSMSFLTGLFPNIFGGGRKKLNAEHWLSLFPGSGEWTVKLRNYLPSRIHYDVDMKYLAPVVLDFMALHRWQFCEPGTPHSTCLPVFYEILRQEKAGGGVQVPGITPQGGGGWLQAGIMPGSITPLLIGAAIFLLILKSNKKN